MEKCVIYKRTSSSTNTGKDQDSSKRQEEICRSYCTANKLEPVQIFYNEGVSGKQPVLKRNGFKSLYTFCLDSDIRILVFGGLSRLSRDLYEQELAYRKLSADGFKLVSATNEGELEDSPQSTLVRHIFSAISPYQREEVVFNLSIARERKRKQNTIAGYVTMDGEGKCGRRKQHSELNPEIVKRVKLLRRKNWKTKKQKSSREIANVLYAEGFTNQNGNKFNPKSIRNMMKQ